ncbi:unnamed protein product [Orchesella dallaii]|uniref:GTP:AMP phosphotransferase, mitochondrial n=1 Tax=Orchesella dallaii TaxID=48710 RepID=A0ABP1QLE7_9HEXA
MVFSKPIRQCVGLAMSGRLMMISPVQGFVRKFGYGCTDLGYGTIRAVIFGAPGSGKGTIAQRIVKDFKVQHISSGDVLRSHISKETEYGKQIADIVKVGGLVPSKMLSSLIEIELEKKVPGVKGFLLDGYPRTIEQAGILQNLKSPNLVVFLNVPFDTIIDRIKSRWIHPGSGRIYNLEFSPPKVEGKDDLTGEPLIQREDDKPESVLRRLELYQMEAEPLLAYYRERGVLQEFWGTESNKIYPEVFKCITETYELDADY